MPQFPSWKQQMAAWTDAAQLCQAQLSDAVSDLGARGRDVTRDIPARAIELAEQTRGRCEQIPRSIVDGIRRRINVLGLATKQDVEAQSKLGRNRVSYVLKRFLEEQRAHEEELLESLRSELREELETFAAAIDDNLFTIDKLPPVASTGVEADLDELLDADDDDDVDIELVAYDELLGEGEGDGDGDEFELTEDDRRLLDASDG